MLFGGLITIPFWGWQKLSVAQTDIMMSDMPHIEYRKENKAISKEKQQMLVDINNANRKKIQEHGLSGLLGIDLSKAKTDKEVADAVK